MANAHVYSHVFKLRKHLNSQTGLNIDKLTASSVLISWLWFKSGDPVKIKGKISAGEGFK